MIVNPREIASVPHDAWRMTTHDLTSLSQSIERLLALARTGTSRNLLTLRDGMRATSQRAARRDAYVEKVREREERRRLWAR
jgi:hypothetical protein